MSADIDRAIAAAEGQEQLVQLSGRFPRTGREWHIAVPVDLKEDEHYNLLINIAAKLPRLLEQERAKRPTVEIARSMPAPPRRA